MSQTVSMIGLQPGELRWVRLLVSLLRHPDPAVAQLTKQALLYLSRPDSQGPSDAASPSGRIDQAQR